MFVFIVSSEVMFMSVLSLTIRTFPLIDKDKSELTDCDLTLSNTGVKGVEALWPN